MRHLVRVRRAALALLVLLAAPQVALAQEAEAVSLELFTVNNTWMLVATFLVFIMHLGFACLGIGADAGQEHGQHLVQEHGDRRDWARDLCLCWFQFDVSGRV